MLALRFRFRRGQFTVHHTTTVDDRTARTTTPLYVCRTFAMYIWHIRSTRMNFNQVKHEKQTRKRNEANCDLVRSTLTCTCTLLFVYTHTHAHCTLHIARTHHQTHLQACKRTKCLRCAATSRCYWSFCCCSVALPRRHAVGLTKFITHCMLICIIRISMHVRSQPQEGSNPYSTVAVQFSANQQQHADYCCCCTIIFVFTHTRWENTQEQTKNEMRRLSPDYDVGRCSLWISNRSFCQTRVGHFPWATPINSSCVPSTKSISLCHSASAFALAVSQ